MGRSPYKNRNDVRLDCFAMRVNSEERQTLVALAERLQRSQSDVVRLLIREAVRYLLPPPDQHPGGQAAQEEAQ
jgi:hypothetical protein